MSKPVLYSLMAIALAAAGFAAYSLGVILRPAPDLQGTELSDPIDVGHLELVSADGHTVTLGDFGGVTAVFFGYTRCPDICPMTMALLADAYEDLGAPEGLTVVMVTVDPGFDTPEQTHAYATGFHEDFIGLSGSNQQVAAAAGAFYVGYNDTHAGMIHTDALMLVDEAGRFRMVYTSDSVPGVAPDLRRILASGW